MGSITASIVVRVKSNASIVVRVKKKYIFLDYCTVDLPSHSNHTFYPAQNILSTVIAFLTGSQDASEVNIMARQASEVRARKDDSRNQKSNLSEKKLQNYVL